jgi:hypothetical protein
MVVEHLSAPAASGNMNVNRKPDLVLALLYLEVCLGSVIPLGLSTAGTGRVYGLISLPFVALFAVGYVVIESVRCAKPLTGVLVGAFGFLVYIVGHVIGNLLYFRYPGSNREAILFGATFVGFGALLGLTASTICWLVRRRRNIHSTNTGAARAPGLRGSLAVGAVILSVLPLLESLLMTLQLDVTDSIQGLLEAGGPAPGRQLLSWDRQMLIMLSVLAAYSVFRRPRWRRLAVVVYLGLGVVLAVVHLLVGIRLDTLVAMHGSSGSGYIHANVGLPYYPVALSVYIRACGIEVAVRAFLCAVGIPWVFISGIKSKSLNDAG